MPVKKIADRSKLSKFQKIYLWSVLTIIVMPFVPLFIQSISFQWDWPDMFPSIWWWEMRENSRFPLSWDYVLSPYSHLREAVFNTFAIGIAVTIICLVICLPAAKVLARESFKFKSVVDFFFSLPLLLPEIAVGISLLVVFIQLGLAGTFTGIIIAHLIPTIPYMTRMLTSVYQGLGTDFEEQASILGANKFQILLFVTIPMLMPGIVAGCLFTFLVSTNVFLLTFLVGQGSIETLPTLLFSKIGGGALDASAAGLTLVASVPVSFY